MVRPRRDEASPFSAIQKRSARTPRGEHAGAKRRLPPRVQALGRDERAPSAVRRNDGHENPLKTRSPTCALPRGTGAPGAWRSDFPAAAPEAVAGIDHLVHRLFVAPLVSLHAEYVLCELLEHRQSTPWVSSNAARTASSSRRARPSRFAHDKTPSAVCPRRNRSSRRAPRCARGWPRPRRARRPPRVVLGDVRCARATLARSRAVRSVARSKLREVVFHRRKIRLWLVRNRSCARSREERRSVLDGPFVRGPCSRAMVLGSRVVLGVDGLLVVVLDEAKPAPVQPFQKEKERIFVVRRANSRIPSNWPRPAYATERATSKSLIVSMAEDPSRVPLISTGEKGALDAPRSRQHQPENADPTPPPQRVFRIRTRFYTLTPSAVTRCFGSPRRRGGITRARRAARRRSSCGRAGRDPPADRLRSPRPPAVAAPSI